MTASGRQCVARGMVGVVMTIGSVAMLAPPAYAEAPSRVGWWNLVSAGAVAAPAPTTPSGGLHIAAVPGQVLAYGAVFYQLPRHAVVVQLTLTIAGSQGTVKLLACPTKSDSWKGGDDQSSDSAPAYDCGTTPPTGAVAADGKSVSFALTSFPTDSLSVALVPDLSQPFSVDLDKPGASSLKVTTAAPTTGAASPPPPTARTTAPQTSDNAATSAGRPLAVPNLPPSTAQTAPSDAGVVPQVAPSAPSAAAPQQVASASRSTSGTVGSVIGVLAMVTALMFWGLGRGLLGGRVQPLSIPTRSPQS